LHFASIGYCIETNRDHKLCIIVAKSEGSCSTL